MPQHKGEEKRKHLGTAKIPKYVGTSGYSAINGAGRGVTITEKISFQEDLHVNSLDFRATALLADIRLFSPSKMSIISTPRGLETIKKDLCIVKETKKVFEIRFQKLHFGEFQEIQLIIVQNRR